MEKREKQIAVVLIISILLIAAIIFVWQGPLSDMSDNNDGLAPETNGEKTGEPAEQQEPVEKVKIDTLEVTYWNPWGGQTENSYLHLDYPPFRLADYIQGSGIIVSATVSSTTEWNDSSSAGNAKLKELGSPWLSSSNRECYLIVNDVLKGDFDINRVYLKTDMKTPALRSGQEYILFIDGSEGNYEIHVTEGYLLKNGSNYEGMFNLSIPKEDLEYLASFSDEELTWYQSMAWDSNVFIGEMLTSTNDDELVHTEGLRSKQVHQVRVVDTIKGNLSGTVNFTYDGFYVTEAMFQTYAAGENMSPDLAKRYASTWLESNGTGYYQEGRWDPEISPLKAGDVYLICLHESEGVYRMGASVTDYGIDEHNQKELQKKAQEYRETLEKIEPYLSYGLY